MQMKIYLVQSPSLFESSQDSSTSGSTKTHHCPLFGSVHLWTVASLLAFLMDLVEDGNDGTKLGRRSCRDKFPPRCGRVEGLEPVQEISLVLRLYSSRHKEHREK